MDVCRAIPFGISLVFKHIKRCVEGSLPKHLIKVTAASQSHWSQVTTGSKSCGKPEGKQLWMQSPAHTSSRTSTASTGRRKPYGPRAVSSFLSHFCLGKWVPSASWQDHKGFSDAIIKAFDLEEAVLLDKLMPRGTQRIYGCL